MNLYITVWDHDDEGLFVDRDMIDEYSFDFMMPAGQATEECFDGVRYPPKSRYATLVLLVVQEILVCVIL